MSPLLLAALLVADAGVAEPERLPAACVGRNLDIDRLIASGRCVFNKSPRPSPDPAAIGIEMSPKKLRLRSGETGRVRITIRNLTAAPVPFDVNISCGPGGFETMLVTSDDTRADRRNHGFETSSCTVLIVRVVLGPRGTARLHVPVAAEKTFVAETGNGGTVFPIEAGTYKLVVNTPFTAPVPGSNDEDIRSLTGQLTVVDR